MQQLPPAPLAPQLPQEPDDAYVRFLFYLHIGPSRSVDQAYRAYKSGGSSSRTTPNNAKQRRSSGQWDRDCREYHWRERASKWDIAYLKYVVPEAVTRIYQVINEVALYLVVALQSKSVTPQTWDEILETLALLTSLVSPDVIEQMLANHSESSSTPQEDDHL